MSYAFPAMDTTTRESVRSWNGVPALTGHAGLVRRGRVLEVLSRSSEARAVCLQAPGGYGKTTALAQWLEREDRPVVWLSVRPEASDAGWVAQALVEGFVGAGLLGIATAMPLSVDPITWASGVLPSIERDLASIVEPYVVVVDDAGELSGMAWETLLDVIIRHLPRGAQLVLATRSAVPRPLRRLRSAKQLLTLGPDQLALDAIEGAEMLRALGVQASDDILLSVLEESEGWPVAFYLTALSVGARPGRAARRQRLVGAPALVDYLRDEILDRLAPEDAHFLLRASVLTYLDEATCDAVTGGRASLARLRHLAADNHLLVPLDPQGEQFRLHALLVEFLSAEFRTTDPSGWRAAHATASLLREEAGDVDAAAHHAKLAGDDARLGALLWRHAGRLLASSRAADLRRWLDGVSEARLSRVCELALCDAWLASHEGDMVRMERMAVVAEGLSVRQCPELAGHVGLLRATIGAAGLDQIESAATTFIATSGADDLWQSLAHFLHGIALTLTGQPDPALVALDRGCRFARAFSLTVMESHCLAAQADVLLAAGDTDRALPLVRQARTIIATQRLDLIATTAPVFTTSAAGYMAEHRPIEARREAMRALRQSALMQSIAPWYAVQARVALAEIFHGLGDAARAAALLDEAATFRGPATRSVVLDAAFERVQREVGRGHESPVLGNLTAAEVRVIQYLPTHLSFPAIAQELSVSPHTVKTQAMSAYRKLGAHTRGDAIRRAREVGLLPDGAGPQSP